MNLAARLDKLNLAGEQWRARYYAPLLRLCRWLHISASQVTVFRVILAAAYAVLILRSATVAIILIIASILLDTFDGALARYLKTDSDRGKFIDVLADQITFVFLCLGLIRCLPDLSHPIATAMVTIPLAYLMAMVSMNERKTSGWIIRPQARMTTYKAVFIAVILGFLWHWWDEPALRKLSWIIAVAAGVHFCSHFYRFARRGKSHL